MKIQNFKIIQDIGLLNDSKAKKRNNLYEKLKEFEEKLEYSYTNPNGNSSKIRR